MKINLFFSNAVIYNLSGSNTEASRIDVVKGETFSVVLEDYSGERIFSDFDQVLQLEVIAGSPDFKIITKEVGTSEVQIQDRTNRATVRFLTVNVVDSISLPAADLGLTFGDKRPKE